MDRERFEQLKQKENEILRGRPVGGVVNGYGADNGLTPEQTIGFINKQSAADEDWKAAKAFYNGSVNQLERGILGTLAMIKDNNIASLQAQGIAVGDGGKYIDMALNSEHLQPYEVKGKTALGQFGLDLASGAGQLVSQAALALTTGGVGSTVAMGASIAGNQYADLRKEGVSVERATNASLINAAVQAPLERLSIGNILSKLPAGSGMRQKAIQIAQNAVTEGVTEYVQQYPEEITNLYAKSGGNLEELANATIDKLPEIHQNALYAGAIGALLGGGAGTINVALQRNMNAAQLEAVEGRVEQAKQIGITPEAYANTVNNNLPDSNVSVDGDVLLKFMQSGKTEEIAQSLGVTVNEVQQAADEGLTVEIRQGNYEGTAMKYADFMPAVKDYSAFEVNGFMQSDAQGQKELQKEYQQFTDNEEEFQAYKDEKIAEMQAAGINKQEALNAMILLESRARVYNPDNPLAFFEAYPIEFRSGENNKDGYNQSAAYFNDFSEHRGQGYSGYSKSNNAIEAESKGRYPASVAAKKLGVKTGAIKLYIDTDEWHHTSSMYNRTPYYDIRYLLEYKVGGKEALQAEGLEESEITDIEKLYEQLKNYKEPKKDEQVYKADVEYIVWSGTKSRPKANVKTYKNIEVREKGSFYTFVLPDGSTVRKKISSNGTNVTRIYTAEEKAERARRAEEVRRQNMLESALNNEKQDAELLEHIQLGEETKRWLNENADKTEGSNSGNLYAEGRKPSRADYDKGLDKFFKKGERRLSPMGKAVVLEEWDGKKWQTIEKSLPLDVSDDYESSVVYFAANAYERNKFLNNERAHAEKSANIYNQSAINTSSDLTQSQAFKTWFGNSVITNDDGNPLVVYHATDSDFKIFNKRKLGTLTKGNTWDNAVIRSAKIGFWFNERDLSDAMGTPSQKTKSVYLKIENPYETSTTNIIEELRTKTANDYVNDLVYRGYDGLIVRDDEFGGNSYVVFDNKQIKAVDNRGTFDSNSANIYNQSAYHGTPHSFERFDLGAIGTGEGAQAHGWGLYFAADRKVAENYKENLRTDAEGRLLFNGQKYKRNLEGQWRKESTDEIANSALARALNIIDSGVDKDIAIKRLKGNIAYNERKTSENPAYETETTELKKVLDYLNDGEFERYNEGLATLYEVDIPENDVLLDEDKPLNKQPLAVRKAILEYYKSRPDNYITEGITIDDLDSQKGGQFYKDVVFQMQSEGAENPPKAASELLNEYGIKGITYDGARDGRCFVVFDDKAISIINRYNQSAGIHARTANRELLNEAQAMAAEGKMQQEIYKKTGWRRGADGNWRFEIPDNLDKIDIKKLQGTKQFFSLAEIYDNEKLYEAYPFLREVTIQKEKLDSNRLGYSEGDYLIVIDSDVDEWFTPGTIIHELQHIIQNYEGFASGGNTRQVRTLLNEAIRKKTEEARSLAPHATMYYNRRREYEMAMIMGDEARMKELEGPIKKLEQEIPNKARRDRIYRLFSEADKLLKNANKMNDRQLYMNLYGEKEARAAEEKARISTRMERNRQKGNTQYDEILRDYTERLPEELQPVAKEYVDLIKRPLAERDFDRETELEEQLLDNEVASEFYNKISDSQWEAAGTGELQKEYDETVFLPEKADAVVIFNDNLVASYSEQSANEGNRGSIRWNNDGAAIVELFSAADASTFIHESIGHYFANVLAKEAVLPGANEQTVKDFETMLNYAGTTRERWEYLNSKLRPALTEQEDAELVKIQETWATAAEQYILEGKAPNRELQPVFNRFKKWLINVYKTIESFVKNNQYAVPITDEVRQVFDRMLANGQQISEMEKLNGYYAKLPKAITDNLSDAYKTRLYDAMAKAHDKAVQLLTQKSLENFTAERKEQIAEYRADMRPKVAEQVDNEPLYRAEKEAADMITSGGKQPKTIARRYIDSNAQEYKDWKSELDRVQSDINSRLDPIIQALEAGMGNGVAKVRDDATGRYIRISNNDPWYSDFYKTYKRRPTKAELRDMAYKIYVGEGYNLLPDSVARNAEEEAAYAELKEDIDGLMEYEEELLSYKGEMEQYKGKGLSDEDAYTFDMLAEEYGFSSGDDLAKAILESPTRQQAIKQRLDDEVQKKFPDIYKERRLAEAAAQEAFYNDDTGAVLGLEEQIIEDAAKRTLDQQRNAEQQRQLAQMKRQQAKVQAQGYLRSVPLREALRIQKYITAERRAAANAATALAKGDYETALDYKHKQLLNHAMVQESINMNRRYAQYGRFLNRQRKLKKESWNNEDNFMQVGALFARMGLRLRGYDARLKQQSLKEWADAMQADYDNVAIPDWIYDESRTFTSPLSDLTFDEYEDVVNALKNIKAVVKAQTMMEGEAKAKTFAETKAEGMAVLEKKPTKYTPDVNEKGKASAFAKFKRQLRNSDNFFEMIDGWTYGWYSKFFGETVRKAADTEAELTMQYEDATRQAYKEWLPDKAARKAANAKVKYDELGTSATKHTLIYMALNLGNESNAAKLCSTAVNSTFREFFPQSQLWVEGDVIQTKKNLLEFLGQNLTAADWRYVQQKIDIANMFWTQMSELERRDKGFAPPKVEAYPEIITLADGQQIVYRGGYFPLIRRRDTGSHPASQDAIPATTGGRPGDSIRTLHTNAGHTKARDNSVYPIDLTGGGEYAVAMDTIHDIAFREPMNNFRKLMNDREFYNMLKSKLDIADMEALEEFLKKAAQPYGGSGFATLSERDTGRFMSWLRNKTVNAAIMLNFKTSLQNLGNPLLYGRVVDGFGYADVLAAYANYQKNWQGRKGFHAMRDFVYSKSAFMRERGQLPDISLRDMKEEGAELNPIEKRTIKWGTQMLTFTDNLSALPVWLQAYQKKINAKASEQEAIQFADTVIRRTLGSSRITDVAPIQRGGPLMKLLTTFQGFFNTQYNQWNREFNVVTRLIKEGSYGTAAGRVTAFAASKFLLFNLLNLALALENPFDDDDDDGWPKIATELLHYPISLLGPVGGIANATLNNMLGIRDYGYNMTAIEGSLDKLFKAGKLVGDIADGDKEVEEAVEPVAGVVTMAAGIPNQLNKLFFNAWDILYNDMDAEWRDLFYRRPAKDR